jgi:hypothetical protein
MQPEIQTGTYALFQKIQTPSGPVWCYDRQERSAPAIAEWIREQDILKHLTKNSTESRIIDYKIVHLED